MHPCLMIQIEVNALTSIEDEAGLEEDGKDNVDGINEGCCDDRAVEGSDEVGCNVDGDKDERTWMIRRISSRAAVELKSVGNTIPAALVGKDVMASNASR